MTIYSLHRWSVVGDVSPYKAPEQNVVRLSGFRNQDSRRVTTTAIVAVDGREITTYSGSTYILEDIDPDYLKHLDDIGEVYNFDNPIRLKD
jgi:hypothetical protein